VAFRAFRSVESEIFMFNNPPIPDDSLFEENPKTLRYINEELITEGHHFDPLSGTFSVPMEGVYVFYISFCTFNANQGASLRLIRNNEAIREFQVPIHSQQSVGVLLSAQNSTLPFPFNSLQPNQDIEENVALHSYSFITSLEIGDKVKLQLVSGAIVELSSRSGMERQFCTEFSGVRISN